MKKFKNFIFVFFVVYHSILDYRICNAFEPHFDADIDIELCPEYQFGGITIEVYYSIGDSTELIPAQIINSSVNLENKTFSARLRFPSDRGTTNFKITSFCKSSLGLSKASNTISFSNCDKLALYDSDFDGITNNKEDTNCDNLFSPGDFSNPYNIDSDGDGVADLVESLTNTSPTNQGDSPRPFIVSYHNFDPDSDGVTNPVVWRPGSGTWYIKNTNNTATTFNFGIKNDIPFIYHDYNQQSNVGVVRRNGNNLVWYFRGNGFPDTQGHSAMTFGANQITFGVFGDIIVPGAWEKPGITNPAVARLYNGIWDIYILMSDRSIKRIVWGGNGDILKPQDLNGDGLLDAAVYRPENQTTYVKYTNIEFAESFNFGTGTSDFTVKGDFTGDGTEEIAFWEPIEAKFFGLKSNLGFNVNQGRFKNSSFYFEVNLGQYFNELPISWNNDGTKNIFTTINHFTGVRKFYPNNNNTLQLESFQWGLYGDFQG